MTRHCSTPVVRGLAALALVSATLAPLRARALCPASPGDIAPDGTVNVVDAQCAILGVLWSLAGAQAPPPACIAPVTDPLFHFDVNCDGAVSVVDVQIVISQALSLPLGPSLDANANGCIDACEAIDTDGDGTADGLDCAPGDAAVAPGLPETCDAFDDNCDGATDEAPAASSCTAGPCDAPAACAAPQPPASVLITEVHPTPAAGPMASWIEIHNPGPPLSLAKLHLEIDGVERALSWVGPPPTLHTGEWAVLARTLAPAVVGVPPIARFGGGPLPDAGAARLLVDGGAGPQVVAFFAWEPVGPGNSLALADLAGADPLAPVPLTLATHVYKTTAAGPEHGTPAGPNRDLQPSACVPSGPAPCDDGLVCTDDTCLPDGTCKHTVSAACDDGNPCMLDVCVGPAPGSCAHDWAPAGTSCDDGDACTVKDTCAKGQCAGTPVDCDDANPCTVDACLGKGGCIHAPLLGKACDDGDPCTTGDACDASGACAPGTPVDCDDGNACTTDACVATAAGPSCAHEKVSCDDGDACTVDACLPGVGCVHASVTCFDGNQCTDDACDAAGGCVYTPLNNVPCDDGDACTMGDFCANGTCMAKEPTWCGDDNPCTEDTCDPVAGCQHTPLSGTPCDDGNPCTTGDVCASGACITHEPVVCDDGNACTTDACDPATGCVYTPVAAGTKCDDGNPCTQGDLCDGQGGCSGKAIACDDGNPCTLDTCSPLGGGCMHANVPPGGKCDDGNACTTGETCDANGQCGGGTAVACDDGNACTTDSCDPATGCIHSDGGCDDGNPCTTDTCGAAGQCAHAPAPGAACDDGNPCTQNDACDDTGACVGTPSVDCNDGDPCTVDTCDPTTAQCTHAPAPGAACDDGNPCTGPDVCGVGGCRGTVLACDDGNPCTVDTCDPKAGGCTYTPAPGAPCDDGDPCTGPDTCTGKALVCTGPMTVCDDGNACTTDACVATAAGPSCSHQKVSCNDGDPCTVDGCDPATGCTTANACDDSNPCTVDLCTPGKGGTLSCAHEPVGAGLPCDDGNACTIKDACTVKGACAGIPAPAGTACEDGNLCTLDECDGKGICRPLYDRICNDANPCTTDVCEPNLGCVYQAVADGTPCTSGNACQTEEQCTLGICTGGLPISCDDANPCTADTCNPAKGCMHTVIAGASCDDGNPCTTGESCDATGNCTSSQPPCDDGNACTTDACISFPFGGKPICTHGNIVCNDGIACTLDTCDPATGCIYTPDDTACDDGNPCTTDTCALKAGGCIHTAAADGTPCDDGVACTAGDICKGGTCQGLADCDDANPCTTDTCAHKFGGVCIHGPVADGTPCDDGDVCTLETACLGGACAQVLSTRKCDDANPCTADLCDPHKGCLYPPVPDGSSCDDGNTCTRMDACKGGQCNGQLVTALCDDGDPCTIDVCVNVPGATYDCQHAPVDCDDGLACTKDGCNGGSCQHVDLCGTEGCTVLACSPTSGQCEVAGDIPDGQACDDGDICTYDDTCASGSCVGQPIDCTNGSPCLTGACDPLAGCYNTPILPPPTTCDDGNACTGGDHCLPTGQCLGDQPVDCDDGNGCTDDACDPSAGCTHSPNVGAWCDDGDECTLGDQCDSSGACTGAPKDCDDANPCTDDACDPVTGTCSWTNNTAPCTAGLPCWTGQCSQGSCQLTAPDPACTEAPVPICELTGSAGSTVDCVLDMARIAQGSPLPVDAHFDLVFDPAVVQVVKLYDAYNCVGNACQEIDLSSGGNLDPLGHPVTPAPSPVSAWNGTGAGTVNIWTSINPTVGITDAWWDAGAGQFQSDTEFARIRLQLTQSVPPTSPVWLGVQNIGGTGYDPVQAQGGITLVGTVIDDVIVLQPGCTADPTICADANACTDDVCDPATGRCVFPFNSAPCDDSDVCTTSDQCSLGQCVGLGTLDCSDGNVCTDDLCDPVSGCYHQDNTDPCDDGDLCTAPDACANGACAGGPPVDCSDGADCTTDTCDPVAGCTYQADDALCDDADVCTVDACWVGVGCVHTAGPDGVACDDGDACTSASECMGGQCLATSYVKCKPAATSECEAVACDPAVGCVSTPDDTLCDDANDCTTDGCDAATFVCGHAPVADGSPCDDGLACTDDACLAGACAGTPVGCDDGNACTVDSCDDTVGCLHTPVADGSPCDDGNACTTEACTQGTCAPTSFDPACSGVASTICSLSGTAGQTVRCPLRLARMASWVALPAALQFDLFYDATRADAVRILDTFCLPNGNCFEVDTPPNVLWPTGHTVATAPAPVAAWAGSARVVVAKPPGQQAITDAFLQAGQIGQLVGDPEFAELELTLLADVPASNPVEVQVTGILASSFAPDPLPGWVLADGAGTGIMVIGPEQCPPGANSLCDDGDPCTEDACAASPTGAGADCVHTPVQKPVACWDGDDCTVDDHCVDGTCVGTSLCPDDGNPCTLESCRDGQCFSEDAPDGTPCDDGNACTAQSVCIAGQCMPQDTSWGIYPDRGIYDADRLTDGRYVLVGQQRLKTVGPLTDHCWIGVTKPNSTTLAAEYLDKGCAAGGTMVMQVSATNDGGWIALSQGTVPSDLRLTRYKPDGSVVWSLPLEGGMWLSAVTSDGTFALGYVIMSNGAESLRIEIREPGAGAVLASTVTPLVTSGGLGQVLSGIELLPGGDVLATLWRNGPDGHGLQEMVAWNWLNGQTHRVLVDADALGKPAPPVLAGDGSLWNLWWTYDGVQWDQGVGELMALLAGGPAAALPWNNGGLEGFSIGLATRWRNAAGVIAGGLHPGISPQFPYLTWFFAQAFGTAPLWSSQVGLQTPLPLQNNGWWLLPAHRAGIRSPGSTSYAFAGTAFYGPALPQAFTLAQNLAGYLVLLDAQGNPIGPCDDGNPCTVDSCSADGVCLHDPIDPKLCKAMVANGGLECLKASSCDDGDPCTLDDCIQSGLCRHWQGWKATAGPGCTTAPVDCKGTLWDYPTLKCNLPNPCDDGLTCTADVLLGDGTCLHTVTQACNDGDPCTVDTCDGPAPGACGHKPGNAGAACDDGDPCTLQDVCAAGGQCAGTPKVCDDGNPCTQDRCDAATGQCVGDSLPPGTACDDGNACTGPDACTGGGCPDKAFDLSQAGMSLTMVPLQSGTDAQSFYSYDTPAPASANTGYEQSNRGSFILHEDPTGRLDLLVILDIANDADGGEVTLQLTGLAGESVLFIDDPNIATDYYDPNTGQYHAAWSPCCTDGVIIGPLAGAACFTIQPLQIAGIDGWDFVDGTTGQRVALPTLMDPITVCTHCPDLPSQCVGPTLLDCNDGNGCTMDACAPDAAGNLTCTHTPVSCDDGNPCTADSCLELNNAGSATCVHAPLTGTPCMDSNGCQATCEAGTCTPIPGASCL